MDEEMEGEMEGEIEEEWEEEWEEEEIDSGFVLPPQEQQPAAKKKKMDLSEQFIELSNIFSHSETFEELREFMDDANVNVLRSWLETRGILAVASQKHQLRNWIEECWERGRDSPDLDLSHHQRMNRLMKTLLQGSSWSQASTKAWEELQEIDPNKIWLWLQYVGCRIAEEIQNHKVAIISYFVDHTILVKKNLLTLMRKDGKAASILQPSVYNCLVYFGQQNNKRLIEAGDMVSINPKVKKSKNHYFLEIEVEESNLQESNEFEVIVFDGERKLHSSRHIQSSFTDGNLTIEIEMKERGVFQFCIVIDNMIPFYSAWFEAGSRYVKVKKFYRDLDRVQTVRCSINVINKKGVKRRLKELATFCSQLRF